MKKNELSDIYANKVLVQEAKDNVVVPAGKLEIAKGDKVPVAPGSGDTKAKKDLETPEENKKLSGDKNKAVKENMNTETTNTYEGAFERLFKATLNEDVAEDIAGGVEIPTSNDDMVDEIEDEKDEVNDLVSDLKSVIDHLQSIHDKLTGGGAEHEEGEEEHGGEALEEEPFEEAVDFEDHGHALVNAKSGKDIGTKKDNEVPGAVPVTKGKAVSGELTNEPEPKELGKTEDLADPKPSKTVVKAPKFPKAGSDFFK